MKAHKFIHEYREKSEGRATDQLYGPAKCFVSKTNVLWISYSGKLVRQTSSRHSNMQSLLYGNVKMVKWEECSRCLSTQSTREILFY